jgi:hypothetical protein
MGEWDLEGKTPFNPGNKQVSREIEGNYPCNFTIFNLNEETS